MFDIFILPECPYCKKVLKFLDENKIKYNKFDTNNDDNVLRLLSIGGKDQVPFLYNENTNDKIYESDDIIEYLKKNGQENYAKQ